MVQKWATSTGLGQEQRESSQQKLWNRWLGWGMVIIITLLYLAWLFYHWWFHPLWLGELPAILQEGLMLVESAGIFTLACLWVGLWWFSRRSINSEPFLLPAHLATIEELQLLHPYAFERYVGGLFRIKGYRVVHRGGPGDLGVDLELTNSHGKRAIVQCKRYQNQINPEIVRELYGTLLHEQVSHAFLVTTAEISSAARQWAIGKPLTLIDGATLIQIAAALQP